MNTRGGAERPADSGGSFARQQGLLIGVTLGALLGAAIFTNVRAALRADLAKGRPWRTSTTFALCRPALNDCANARTRILFHTVEEENPWFQLDLEDRRRFSSLVIVNRAECCPERAQPLIVEVGDDAQGPWREIARNEAVFSSWSPAFEPLSARYVRLRVPRLTSLHLEKVEVHR